MSETQEQTLDTSAEFPLGLNGPSRATINKWKTKFAPSQIHAFPMSEEESDFQFVVIRTITRNEFSEVQAKQANPNEFDEWLITNYVLFPDKDTIFKWNDAAAGIILTIGEQIFKKSGFLQNVPSIRL